MDRMKVRVQCPCPEFPDETFYIIASGTPLAATGGHGDATDSNPINDIGAMLDIDFVLNAGKRID